MTAQKFTTYLESNQIIWLRETALKKGITAAELLRQIIDQNKKPSK